MRTPRKKEKIIKENQTHEKDTGSAEVQIAVTTSRIKELSTHLKKHPKDRHSRRGLLSMVNQRRKLLNFLAKDSPTSYKNLVKKLGLKR
ncbi:MAG: 30S ribosomal protein S15 [Candidatus Colwellbacteria bacterium RIFCSPHIGHO2_02_FULL_45_17]|uniref:Small ribosomal subunit protein uS15 n=2 Tax=Candidatus Colwelliibacteriota TaxID=1817904 RepID=A0A1G1ZD30_9BACT|nr:MAG: 30S ribosomal protein S15 [Candidatus Colwellbacteria bacterium RIFCSPHIGHO2_02_FULL_45_17]OGY61217.1 MAG: 30S ribosomal protein S15 [Candidatus Colwellbacteria bacterium RIFCSPLOWO2_02_FULL_45_11]OGY62525.1 MAG: 30S ribosomal protein S15 [Candidatus Colwellbacteria bacterium RIFCSPLOWO2_12_FULL_46_17]